MLAVPTKTPARSRFGQYIEKQAIPVYIHTPQRCIKGNIYVVPGSRVKDAMNMPGEDFIAVTDVTVYGRSLEKYEFLVLKKDQVVWIAPRDANCNRRSPYATVVKKDPVAVILQADSQTLTGLAHIVPGFRLIDVLNRADETFIALTDVQIGQSGNRLGFVAVNRKHVQWLAPMGEM